MKYITEFLNLRERLNHNYIKPKLLLVIQPDQETIRHTFKNPKIWYQIKLRINLLFDIGKNIFKLECPEVFVDLKKQIEKVIEVIDKLVSLVEEDPDVCQDVVKNSGSLTDLLHDMSKYVYTVRYDDIDMSNNQRIIDTIQIKETFRELVEILENALTLNGGEDEDFLALGRNYWDNRVFLEKIVVQQVIFNDMQSIIPGKKFWDTLFLLINTDWIAEEALSIEAFMTERKKKVDKLLEEKNMDSIRGYFEKIESILISALEV
jgi:hypothetical protein